MEDNRNNSLGIELLKNSNYKEWKSCVEFYLVSKEYWDFVSGDQSVVLEDSGELNK